MQRISPYVKPMLALLLIGGALAAWKHPALQPYISQEGIRAHWSTLQTWAQSPWGPLGFVAFSTLAVVFSFPHLVVASLAGLLFSPAAGFALAVTGCTLGASATYYLGRFFFRDVIMRFAERKGKLAWVEGLEHGGFRNMLYLRLAFFMFPLLNWLPGATTIRYRDYLAGTALGAAPWILTLILLVDRLQSGDFRAVAVLGVPGAVLLALQWRKKRAEKKSGPQPPTPV